MLDRWPCDGASAWDMTRPRVVIVVKAGGQWRPRAVRAGGPPKPRFVGYSRSHKKS